MVLHVTAAEAQLRIAVLKLTENRARALAHDVGKHVQPATVGHGNDNFGYPLGAGFLYGQIEQRNQRFAAREREALRPYELLLDEILEDGCVRQLGQNPDLRFAVHIQPVALTLHAGLKPGAYLQVVDVHELHAD